VRWNAFFKSVLNSLIMNWSSSKKSVQLACVKILCSIFATAFSIGQSTTQYLMVTVLCSTFRKFLYYTTSPVNDATTSGIAPYSAVIVQSPQPWLSLIESPTIFSSSRVVPGIVSRQHCNTNTAKKLCLPLILIHS
jgi:hypothetical protein